MIKLGNKIITHDKMVTADGKEYTSMPEGPQLDFLVGTSAPEKLDLLYINVPLINFLNGTEKSYLIEMADITFWAAKKLIKRNDFNPLVLIASVGIVSNSTYKVTTSDGKNSGEVVGAELHKELMKHYQKFNIKKEK